MPENHEHVKVNVLILGVILTSEYHGFTISRLWSVVYLVAQKSDCMQLKNDRLGSYILDQIKKKIEKL